MVSVEDTQNRKITSSIYDAQKFSVNIATKERTFEIQPKIS